jgi:hypothetical protein
VTWTVRHADVEFDLRGLQHQLERQHGVEFEVCPLAGHNQHGHVDRFINYNNLPLGYHYNETADKNPILI